MNVVKLIGHHIEQLILSGHILITNDNVVSECGEVWMQSMSKSTLRAASAAPFSPPAAAAASKSSCLYASALALVSFMRAGLGPRLLASQCSCSPPDGLTESSWIPHQRISDCVADHMASTRHCALTTYLDAIAETSYQTTALHLSNNTVGCFHIMQLYKGKKKRTDDDNDNNNNNMRGIP